MRVLLVLMIGLLITGCSRPVGGNSRHLSADMAEKTGALQASPPSAAAPPTAGSPPQAAATASMPQLAYAYQYGLESPPGRVRGLIARHEAACNAAGFAVCVVTASNIEELGRDSLHATLTLRATPAWLAGFRSGMARDARDANGRMVRAAVTSEDLSTQIIDSEAALRARTTLRDRLQAILQSRPAKTADLVEVATALAKVQGELDATQSMLAAMKLRVVTSEMDIDYASAGVLAPQGVWSPLTHAINQFVGTVASGLGVMISIFAFLLPWALVLGGLAWLFRKRLRGRSWRWRRNRKGAE